MSDDADVSRKYRQLAAEEPPRALDEAILAAARREAGARPAALPARGGRQRWYAPLATAAVLVLAVAVTLNVQRERPEVESPAPQAVPPRAETPVAAAPAIPPKEESRPVSTAGVKPAARPIGKPAAEPAAEADAGARRRDIGQAASGPATAPAPPAAPAARELQPFAADQAQAGQERRQMAERSSRDAEPASRAPMAAAQALAKRADTPERELERIAELRGQGRHDEADKALAEFRQRYPEFRIPEATRERVERR